MNSTNVPSNNEQNMRTTSVAGSIFKPTEKTLEVPPKKQIYEIIPSYIEEQGNMEIPTGNAKVYENGILETENGTTKKMTNPKAFQNMKVENQRKAEMKIKAAKTSKMQEEVR